MLPQDQAKALNGGWACGVVVNPCLVPNDIEGVYKEGGEPMET